MTHPREMRITTVFFFQGHEMTLNVLYRLYRETEQDKDFFSSSAAVSAYETFLISVVGDCSCYPILLITT